VPEVLAVGRDNLRVTELTGEIRAATERLRGNEARIAELRDNNALVGLATVLSPGDVPSKPYKDRRIAFAGAGAAAGFGGVMTMFVVFGLARRRLRHSSDVENFLLPAVEAASPTGGPAFRPVVGVLPKLSRGKGGNGGRGGPTAAFAVHRLRTQIQTAPGAAARRVLAVTSPASGDGKTSLALSLALSHAAAGQRVLLIDLDFVGQGLTRWMGRPARRPLGRLLLDEGWLDRRQLDAALAEAGKSGRRLGETLIAAGTLPPIRIRAALERQGREGRALQDALAGADPASCASETAVAGLWTLVPAAEDAAAEQAGPVPELTPSSVRSLMERARAAFDIVIVDTGSLTGAVEAMAAAASADAAVVVIGRGSSERSAAVCLTQLEAMGVPVAAVVFNRARRGELSWVRGLPLMKLRRAPRPGETVDLGSVGPLPAAVVANPMPWGAVRPARKALPSKPSTNGSGSNGSMTSAPSAKA
jgi:Mrp family chromosome partitioning ATPase